MPQSKREHQPTNPKNPSAASACAMILVLETPAERHQTKRTRRTCARFHRTHPRPRGRQRSTSGSLRNFRHAMHHVVPLERSKTWSTMRTMHSRRRGTRGAPHRTSKGRERMIPGSELEKKRQRREDSTRAQCEWEDTRTRTRTNTIPYDTKANATG